MDTKELNIYEMFKKCGLKLILKDGSFNQYYLPTEYELMFNTNNEYKNFSEKSKLEEIKKILFNENYLTIENFEFFLPDFMDSTIQERTMLDSVFRSIRINLNNGKLEFVLRNLYDQHLIELIKNKDFVKQFSKNFLVKEMFSTEEQTIMYLKLEIINLVKNKVIELGIQDKINIALPQYVLKNLK